MKMKIIFFLTKSNRTFSSNLQNDHIQVGIEWALESNFDIEIKSSIFSRIPSTFLSLTLLFKTQTKSLVLPTRRDVVGVKLNVETTYLLGLEIQIGCKETRMI